MSNPLASLGRKSYVSLNGLETLLAELRDIGHIPETSSRRTIKRATARDRSHSAAVAKRIAAGVEELGSEGPVEEGSCEGQVEQGSGVSPWMLAGDAAYLSKSELSTLQNEHVLRSHILGRAWGLVCTYCLYYLHGLNAILSQADLWMLYKSLSKWI